MAAVETGAGVRVRVCNRLPKIVKLILSAYIIDELGRDCKAFSSEVTFRRPHVVLATKGRFILLFIGSVFTAANTVSSDEIGGGACLG